MLTATTDAARYFQAHYVLWAVGKLEVELCHELDSMTPPFRENWKQIMARQFDWPRRSLQERFNSLRETMTDEDALDALFQEIGFHKQ